MTELELAAMVFANSFKLSELYLPEDFRTAFIESFETGAEWQAKQSPWISVEERLPEYTQYDKKRYVAKVEYGSMIKEYQTAIVWMQNKFKFNIEMDWVKVTHWMEIPE